MQLSSSPAASSLTIDMASVVGVISCRSSPSFGALTPPQPVLQTGLATPPAPQNQRSSLGPPGSPVASRCSLGSNGSVASCASRATPQEVQSALGRVGLPVGPSSTGHTALQPPGNPSMASCASPRTSSPRFVARISTDVAEGTVLFRPEVRICASPSSRIVVEQESVGQHANKEAVRLSRGVSDNGLKKPMSSASKADVSAQQRSLRRKESELKWLQKRRPKGSRSAPSSRSPSPSNGRSQRPEPTANDGAATLQQLADRVVGLANKLDAKVRIIEDNVKGPHLQSNGPMRKHAMPATSEGLAHVAGSKATVSRPKRKVGNAKSVALREEMSRRDELCQENQKLWQQLFLTLGADEQEAFAASQSGEGRRQLANAILERKPEQEEGLASICSAAETATTADRVSMMRTQMPMQHPGVVPCSSRTISPVWSVPNLSVHQHSQGRTPPTSPRWGGGQIPQQEIPRLLTTSTVQCTPCATPPVSPRWGAGVEAL